MMTAGQERVIRQPPLPLGPYALLRVYWPLGQKRDGVILAAGGCEGHGTSPPSHQQATVPFTLNAESSVQAQPLSGACNKGPRGQN
ncbi:hypothetical protein SKAU_G00255080 [Synaphobranchus kaupii]|uniref:Uncharacterized protein n=1 Tax=Synaphobranchus kaupii TaxID=118154 RepID=A0A9Q1IRZ7_SYNKA|nr:hypothetical protein SKAU_G00255080 [Synaphobranchus kaupii]